MDTSKKAECKSSKKEWQDEALQELLTCVLCGSDLKFKHKVDHITGVAHEEANCPSCNVKSRSNEHRLQ